MEIVLLIAAFIVRQHMHRQHITFFFKLFFRSFSSLFFFFVSCTRVILKLLAAARRVGPPRSDPEAGRGGSSQGVGIIRVSCI